MTYNWNRCELAALNRTIARETGIRSKDQNIELAPPPPLVSLSLSLSLSVSRLWSVEEIAGKMGPVSVILLDKFTEMPLHG